MKSQIILTEDFLMIRNCHW